MRSKAIMKTITVFLTCGMLIGASPVTALAYGNGEEETETVSEETSISADGIDETDTGEPGKSDNSEKHDGEDGALIKEDDSLDVEWSIVEKHDPDGEGILTPVGNLTLVDDLDEEESKNLQYMTVKTKSGNIFYLIVDRNGDEDNVYFLNMVDESDLMALMDEETQEKFREATAPEAPVKETEVSADTLLFSNQDKENDSKDAANGQKEEKKNTGSNPLVTLIIFVIIGGGVAGGYYFFKIKPQKEQPALDEDLEFYDDEDYVNEDEMTDDAPAEDDPYGGEHSEESDTGDDTGADDADDYHPGVDDFSDDSVD